MPRLRFRRLELQCIVISRGLVRLLDVYVHPLSSDTSGETPFQSVAAAGGERSVGIINDRQTKAMPARKHRWKICCCDFFLWRKVNEFCMMIRRKSPMHSMINVVEMGRSSVRRTISKRFQRTPKATRCHCRRVRIELTRIVSA